MTDLTGSAAVAPATSKTPEEEAADFFKVFEVEVEKTTQQQSQTPSTGSQQSPQIQQQSQTQKKGFTIADLLNNNCSLGEFIAALLKKSDQEIEQFAEHWKNVDPKILSNRILNDPTTPGGSDFITQSLKNRQDMIRENVQTIKDTKEIFENQENIKKLDKEFKNFINQNNGEKQTPENNLKEIIEANEKFINLFPEDQKDSIPSLDKLIKDNFDKKRNLNYNYKNLIGELAKQVKPLEEKKLNQLDETERKKQITETIGVPAPDGKNKIDVNYNGLMDDLKTKEENFLKDPAGSTKNLTDAGEVAKSYNDLTNDLNNNLVDFGKLKLSNFKDELKTEIKCDDPNINPLEFVGLDDYKKQLGNLKTALEKERNDLNTDIKLHTNNLNNLFNEANIGYDSFDSIKNTLKIKNDPSSKEDYSNVEIHGGAGAKTYDLTDINKFTDAITEAENVSKPKTEIAKEFDKFNQFTDKFAAAMNASDDNAKEDILVNAFADVLNIDAANKSAFTTAFNNLNTAADAYYAAAAAAADATDADAAAAALNKFKDKIPAAADDVAAFNIYYAMVTALAAGNDVSNQKNALSIAFTNINNLNTDVNKKKAIDDAVNASTGTDINTFKNSFKDKVLEAKKEANGAKAVVAYLERKKLEMENEKANDILNKIGKLEERVKNSELYFDAKNNLEDRKQELIGKQAQKNAEDNIKKNVLDEKTAKNAIYYSAIRVEEGERSEKIDKLFEEYPYRDNGKIIKIDYSITSDLKKNPLAIISAANLIKNSKGGMSAEDALELSAASIKKHPRLAKKMLDYQEKVDRAEDELKKFKQKNGENIKEKFSMAIVNAANSVSIRNDQEKDCAVGFGSIYIELLESMNQEFEKEKGFKPDPQTQKMLNEKAFELAKDTKQGRELYDQCEDKKISPQQNFIEKTFKEFKEIESAQREIERRLDHYKEKRNKFITAAVPAQTYRSYEALGDGVLEKQNNEKVKTAHWYSSNEKKMAAAKKLADNMEKRSAILKRKEIYQKELDNKLGEKKRSKEITDHIKKEGFKKKNDWKKSVKLHEEDLKSFVDTLVESRAVAGEKKSYGHVK